MKFRTLLLATLTSITCGAAQAAEISFSDVQLSSGNPVSSGGLTLTTSTSGGSIAFIGSGTFIGLWLGQSDTAGSYTLSFSQAISSIEIEFDALSGTGTPPPETLFNFANSNGAINISYTNQFGTTFDGTTITSTVGDGQGIIDFAGPDFNSFSFDHDQGVQSGFVIERIVVNTVPIPAAAWLFASALGGLVVVKRKRA